MRVGIDTQSTAGMRTGIGWYTADLLQGLREVAPEVDFVELCRPHAGAMRTDRRLWWQQVAMPAMARRARVDLLHVPGFDAPLCAPCPVVLTVQDLIGMIMPANFPPVSRFYWSRWVPWSARWATRIVVLSEHTRADVLRLLPIPSGRVAVVSAGVAPRFHRMEDPAVLERVRAQHGIVRPFVLFVGTVEPRKGIGTLLAAFDRIAADIPHDLMIVGGPGWTRRRGTDPARACARGDRVKFTGYVAAGDLPPLYSMADLFVLPSDYEGFGLPVLEAMACGAPVVATATSSLPEVAGDAAVLVPPADPAALADAMRRVLGDAAMRSAMRERGLRRAAQFTWQDAARRTLAVYREVLER